MRAALTIAGSDSGSGAGIQADLKTFDAFGIHGLSAITAVTAQNPAGISDIHVLPPAMVTAQIAAVAAEFPVAAAKTGMLAAGGVVAAVCRALETLALRPVVDPVLVSTSGSPLLDADGVRLLQARLLPLAAVVTPNRMEAERLSGIAVASRAAAREAARRILDLGPRAVIVTGGHLDEQADTVVDVLCDGAGAVELATPRVAADGSRLHGTGCAFSAALTAGLAAGRPLAAAAADAQRYVAAAIGRARRAGRSGLVLDHARPGGDERAD
jgi:hydroxymethylpyrimidine/phosphomethylpyrimidine kinase